MSDLQGAFTDRLIERGIREKIVLVGVTLGNESDDDTEAALDELARLVDTAGADAVASVTQRRVTPDPAYFVGKGKAEELLEVATEVDADTVVFDNELSPAQQHNLEKLLKRTAIDRTAVILDIFAQNAHTLEGKAQVELALLRYRLPRVRRGRAAKFTQQTGGVGTTTRGKGETKLEVDRRRIQKRIASLEHDLDALRKTRHTQRKARARSRLQNVSIVGYTNAGKSTLLNRLTDAGVLVENRLFATLDPTTRRLQLPGGESVLVSDTVGFVRKLPHQLVEAFKSTLELTAEADLLVHVVDAGCADPDGQIHAVHQVLSEIGGDHIPELIVFNKIDRVPDAGEVERLVRTHDGSVAISARTGEGFDVLLRAIGDRLRAAARITELVIPYDRGDVIAAVHREGEVLSEVHGDDAVTIRARLDQGSVGKLAAFVVSPATLADS